MVLQQKIGFLSYFVLNLILLLKSMQAPQYIFPKAGVFTNASELKSNQQRLLNQSYLQNTQQPKRKSNLYNQVQSQSNLLRDSNTFKQPQNENKSGFFSRVQSMPRLKKDAHQQVIKNSLSNQLSNQIALKQQIKRIQKAQQLKIQRQMVQYNQMLQHKETLNAKSFNQNFKQQAQHNTQLKALRKQQEKNYENLQKNQIDQQYRKNHQIIEKKMQGVDYTDIPIKPFNRVSYSSMDNYNLNPEIGIVPKQSVHRPSFMQASDLHIKLKQTLLEQMRFKSQRKMNQRLQKINTPFVDEKYKVFDNPIVNPVDIKIAKDNPYLMKELLGKKIMDQKNEMRGSMMGRRGNQNEESSKSKIFGNNQSPSKQPSYLSLRGSSSLSKFAY